MTWLDVDDERFEYLLDLAQHATDEDTVTLSDDIRREVNELRLILEIIDMAWQAPDAVVDRVDALFLQKLAGKQPGHPWVQANIDIHSIQENQ